MSSSLFVRTRNEKGWQDEYRKRKACFVHDGNHLRPHCELTSGLHSTGFYNSRPLIEDNDLLEDVAHDLWCNLLMHPEASGVISRFEFFVGPQTGATKLAESLARITSRHLGYRIEHVSPAKHEAEGRKKSMVFTEDQLAKINGRRGIICEDVVTTAGSTNLTVTATLEGRAKRLHPFVLVMVNRSQQTDITNELFPGGIKIIPLIHDPLPLWEPRSEEGCPLCKAGSEALPPKGNWDRFTAEY